MSTSHTHLVGNPRLIDTEDTEVVVRYAEKRGQLVVDGKDIAGHIVQASIHCAAGRSYLRLTVDAFGTEVTFEAEAVELIATLPMSAAARRTLASLARDDAPASVQP